MGKERTIPLWLFLLALACDVAHFVVGGLPLDAAAFAFLSLGIIATSVAAVRSFDRFRFTPSQSRPELDRLSELLGDIGAIGFGALSWWARLFGHLPDRHWAPFILASVGTMALLATAWLPHARLVRRRPGERRFA